MERLHLNEYEKPSWEHYGIFALCWAGWVFDFYDLILFTFLIIPIGAELHFSMIESSIPLGVSLFATALGGIGFGFLSDRFGRKSVLQWTILIYCIGTFLCGIATNLEMLIIFRVITGLGVGGEWATGQTYISETFPPKVRGRYGAFMQSGAPIGVILASIVGGFLAPIIGWRLCFFISILPALFVILIRTRLRESDLWLEKKKLVDRNELESRSFEAWIDEYLLLFSKAHRKIFVQALLLAFLGMSTYWLAFTWMPDYLTEQRQLSMAKSALWVITINIGAVFGHVLFGFFADWLGRRLAFSLYSLIMALGIAMITMMWNVVAAYNPILFGFMLLIGFGSGFFGGYGSLFSELFPTSIRSTATGSAYNLARGAQLFAPFSVALIAAYYGLGSGIFLAVIFALLQTIWIWMFPETKGIELAK